MQFNLRTMLYAVAVLAAGMGAFGFAGLPIAAIVLGLWAIGELPRSIVVRLLLFLSIVVVLPWLLLPAVNSRPPHPATTCRNNLREIAMALYNYADKHGTFPPPYLADKNGKTMHSWRILIQPYLEGQQVYDAYKFDEPWDGPSNQQLASIDIRDLRCPSSALPAGETAVFAIVGPNAAWIAGRGRKLDEFIDGADQTLLLIEAAGQGVNWLEPKDLSYEEALALLTADNVKQAAVVHADERFLHYTEFSRNVATADAQVGRLPIGCSEELAEKLLTIDGGEQLDSLHGWRNRGWSTESHLHWPRIWGIAVFVVLAVLPKFVTRQAKRPSTSLAETPDALS